MTKRIAITGGIGSGKSSVLHYFAELGYPTFSCDEIYREVIFSPAYIKKINEVFPTCIIDGKIDRKILADIVFGNKEKLAILNGIAHPLILNRLLEKMNNCQNQIVFAEVPLLFEGNFENNFDMVIVVMRKKEDRISAIMQRDQVTREEAVSRISSQFDYDCGEDHFKKCNAILLYNDSSPADLKLLVEKLDF